jgi:hypothetical protein
MNRVYEVTYNGSWLGARQSSLPTTLTKPDEWSIFTKTP